MSSTFFIAGCTELVFLSFSFYSGGRKKCKNIHRKFCPLPKHSPLICSVSDNIQGAKISDLGSDTSACQSFCFFFSSVSPGVHDAHTGWLVMFLFTLFVSFTFFHTVSGLSRRCCVFCVCIDKKMEKVYTSARKQMLISSLPPVITLHLKRFHQVGGHVSFSQLSVFAM